MDNPQLLILMHPYHQTHIFKDLVYNTHLQTETFSAWQSSTTWSFKLGVMSGLVWE